MASMSLYRTYRPGKWAEVIGQDQIVRVLQASIKEGRIAHAYLFAGSRGTGKTSIARIFAETLGTDPDSDLYEIDAASNRGIDEIRELREGVRTLPFNSKYKVYIIDEVHMLTTPAFNALLKTLEEPPAHAIFILATTEAHKLPETIVSRCQIYQFNKPTEEDVGKLILKVTKAEGYEIDEGSISLITLMAEGAFRDALTTLEKLMSSSHDKKIELSEVEKVTGAPRLELVHAFMQALTSNDLAGALKNLSDVREGNLDVRIFAKLLLRDLRYAMLLSHAPDLRKHITDELGVQELGFVENLSKSEGAKRFSLYLREFLQAYTELGTTYIPTLPLELATVRLLSDDKDNMKKV